MRLLAAQDDASIVAADNNDNDDNTQQEEASSSPIPKSLDKARPWPLRTMSSLGLEGTEGDVGTVKDEE